MEHGTGYEDGPRCDCGEPLGRYEVRCPECQDWADACDPTDDGTDDEDGL